MQDADIIYATIDRSIAKRVRVLIFFMERGKKSIEVELIITIPAIPERSHHRVQLRKANERGQ
jgi:hypothetical protein